MRSCWLIIAALLVGTPSWGGEVYRSIDKDGHVSYSDRPEGEHVEKIYVAVPPPASAPPSAAHGGQQPAPQAPAAEGSDDGAEQSAPARPSAEELAQERAKNCAIAKDRVERYGMAHRLYRTTSDGGREYLSDAQIDEARVKAAADVEKWCD